MILKRKVKKRWSAGSDTMSAPGSDIGWQSTEISFLRHQFQYALIMTEPFTLEKLKSELEEEIFLGANIEPDKNLIEAGLLDSLNLFKLMSLLEERYQISFLGREMRIKNFETLRLISNLIEQKILTREGGRDEF